MPVEKELLPKVEGIAQYANRCQRFPIQDAPETDVGIIHATVDKKRDREIEQRRCDRDGGSESINDCIQQNDQDDERPADGGTEQSEVPLLAFEVGSPAREQAPYRETIGYGRKGFQVIIWRPSEQHPRENSSDRSAGHHDRDDREDTLWSQSGERKRPQQIELFLNR